jgi:hypothetical protein
MDHAIPVSLDLQKLMELPDCDLLSLPRAKKLEVHLPNGATLPAFTDISKGVPTDCSLALSLVLQVAPFLASIECLLKILALLDPLIKIVQALTSLPPSVPSPDVITKFGEAAVQVIECVTAMVIPGAGMFSFIKSLLILILTFLRCFVEGLQSIVQMLKGIALQMNAAQAAGNDELQRVLKCAQDNAMGSADHLQNAIGPVMNLIGLVQPILSLAKIDIAVPTIVPGADLDGLNKALQALHDVVTILEQIIEAPPLAAVPPPYPG